MSLCYFQPDLRQVVYRDVQAFTLMEQRAVSDLDSSSGSGDTSNYVHLFVLADLTFFVFLHFFVIGVFGLGEVFFLGILSVCLIGEVRTGYQSTQHRLVSHGDNV